VKGELIRLGDTTVRFLVEGADSGGSAAVFEVESPPAARCRPA
jgi:hypothetical protein